MLLKDKIKIKTKYHMTETEQGNNRYKIRIPCFSIVPKIESNLNRIVPKMPSITNRIEWDNLCQITIRLSLPI
jgi:hypothetical protein